MEFNHDYNDYYQLKDPIKICFIDKKILVQNQGIGGNLKAEIPLFC